MMDVAGLSLTPQEQARLTALTSRAVADRRVLYLSLGSRGGVVCYPDGQQQVVTAAGAQRVLAYARRQLRRAGGPARRPVRVWEKRG